MAKKCKCPPCPPEGAPAWVLTYGDMMSLLLVFFIMLVAMSVIKKDEPKYRAVVDNIQMHFGMKGGGGKIPTIDDPNTSQIERARVIDLRRQEQKQRSNTDDPGMEGRERTVTRIREEFVRVKGGRITFEPGSADLSDMARRQLRLVADQIRGYTFKIDLRGHAASMELASGFSRHPNLLELSFARASAVQAFLTSDEISIDSHRIRLVANADREPLAPRVQTQLEQEPNRRVEVLINESLVDQFTKPERQRPN